MPTNPPSIFKRCGCYTPILADDGTVARESDGRAKRRRLGASCPDLRRSDGTWNPGHGTWFFHLELERRPGSKRANIRSGGHATREAAEKAMRAAADLLALAAKADDPEQAVDCIAAMIRTALKTGTALPDLDEARKRIVTGQSIDVTTTVGQWLRQWLQSKKHVLRPTTHLLYRQHIEHYLIPLLGHHRLDRLRVHHAQAAMDQIIERSLDITAENATRHAVLAASKHAWRDGDHAAAAAHRAKLATMPPFRRPPRAATVQRIRAVLRSALSDAMRQQLISINVASLVVIPSGRAPKALVWTDARVAAWRQTGVVPSPVMVWTAKQTAVFLARAEKHRLNALWKIFAYTGVRRGEGCGLPWENVDLDAQSLDIRQQMVQLGWEFYIADTKTHNGERTVMFSPIVTRALKGHRLAQEAEARNYGPAWKNTGLVFTDFDGGALHPAYVTEQFQLLAREAGLPPIRLHDVRHGVATHLLTAGVDMKVVSEILGHADTGITGDIYTSVVDDAKRAAANAIADQYDC